MSSGQITPMYVVGNYFICAQLRQGAIYEDKGSASGDDRLIVRKAMLANRRRCDDETYDFRTKLLQEPGFYGDQIVRRMDDNMKAIGIRFALDSPNDLRKETGI